MEPQNILQQEKDLEQSERLSVLTELNPNPIIELDFRLNSTYQNAAARMKFPDLNNLQVEHPVLQPLLKVLGEILENTSQFVVYEQELMVKNDIYEVQIFSIAKNKHVYLFMTEITAKKRAEKAKEEMAEQLFQSQKMEAIGQLTGGIAHDFNNILTVIQGNLQLLKLGFQEDSKEMKRVLAALNASNRATDLSKRLLAFSRRGHLEPKVISMPKFVQDLVKLLEPILGKSISLECKLAEDIGAIRVDPSQLENIILNIAVNSRDAMKDNGKIILAIQNTTLEAGSIPKTQVRPGEYVKIDIQDTGSGIPKEVLPHIFEPFYTTKEVGKGTGLGLSQVFGFVTQSQGYISVDTEEGKGTTFHLFFPKIASNGSASEEVNEENEKNEELNKEAATNTSVELQGKEKILLVEDDKAIRGMTSEYLRNLGYQILEAESAQCALILLQQNQDIELIFSDVIMPGGYTGPKLVKEAQKIKPSLKALLTSGYTRDAMKEENNFQLLLKPYKLDDLAKLLRKML